MKVSLIHAERRCAQKIALDVVTPDCVPVVRSSASGRTGDPFPDRLLPTQRIEFDLVRGSLLCLVASAMLKQHGPTPLVVELEAEEGETLHDNSLRVFVLAPPPAYYTEAALDEGYLVRVAAPLTRAGDRQQFGIASIELSPARDALLVAIANRELVVRAPRDTRPEGCLCREYIGGALKIEAYCPVHRAPGAPQ